MTDVSHPDDESPTLFAPEAVPEPVEEAIALGVTEAEEETILSLGGLDDTELATDEDVMADATRMHRESTGAIEAIRELGAMMSKRLDALQAIFEREARAEATRERVVDRLHAELQEYKQDLLLKVVRPVFVDLIQLHDDIGKMVESESDGAEGQALRLLDLMGGFQQGIEDILYRQGVEPFAVEGDAFDPRRQRAVSTATTDDPDLAKTVAARIRKGFRAGEKVIRPEVVSVYALKKSI